MVALNAKLFAILLNATPLAKLLNPNAHLFVKNWTAPTNA
jgi:hypothetical protein